MRIAVFTDTYPSISETFIARQIAGLIKLGHRVDVYAEHRPVGSGQWAVDNRTRVRGQGSGARGQGSVVNGRSMSRRRTIDEPKNELAKPRSYRRSMSQRMNWRSQEAIACPLPTAHRLTYIEMPPASGYWEMPVFPLWGETWLPGAEKALPNARRLAEALPALLRSFLLAPRVAAKVLDPREYGYAAKSLSVLYRVSALLGERGCYDVAHAHFGPVANNFRFVRELWRVPLVVSFHGYDVGAWPHEKGLGVYRRLFRAADLVTTNSNYTRKRVEALGCPPSKIRLLPMGLDLAGFPFRERTPPESGPVQILSVGRLVEKKGFEYAIRAVAQVRARHSLVRYTIIGDGPLRGHLRALASELGLDDIVTFEGAGGGELVRQKMAEAHIFVAPSVTAEDGDVEGQGLVLQEAQACGLPVLATDHNGFPEGMLPGRSGFLVPERSVDDLAGKLSYMIDHAESWAEWGLAGRRHVEQKYDIGKLSRHLDRIYREAILRYKARKQRP